jgi:hypothetical protein
MIRLLDTDTFILLLRGTALVHPRTVREKNRRRVGEADSRALPAGIPRG